MTSTIKITRPGTAFCIKKEQVYINERLSFSAASGISVVYWNIDTYRLLRSTKIKLGGGEEGVEEGAIHKEV